MSTATQNGSATKNGSSNGLNGDIENPLHKLTAEQIEAIGKEFDELHEQVKADLGDRDAAYIRGVIDMHRRLGLLGRVLLVGSRFKPFWVAGTATLSVAKILENMEIGHNVLHGQWDWMNDPVINSRAWDWDTASTAEAWRHSHNYVHHTFTNIRGKDKDLGYEIMRIDPHQPWNPVYLLQPFYNVLLMAFFEWGVAFHDLDLDALRAGEKSKEQLLGELKGIWGKARAQITKDYVAWPLISALAAGAATAAVELARGADTRPRRRKLTGLLRRSRTRQRDRAAAVARRHRERLDQRVQADEPDGEPDRAQHRREHAEERGVAGRRAADRPRRRAERLELALHARAVGARIEADRDRRADVGLRLEQPPRLHVRDPPVVLERAHDAADAEAHLVAALGLHGERRARPQPERVGQPDPDLDLAVAAHAPTLGERRRLEARVVAGVGDHPQRLAEAVRVRDVGLVALGGVGDAGYRLDRVDLEWVQADRELVALADGAGVVAQPLEQRGERQHQRHDAGAHRDRRDRCREPPARGEREASAGGEQPVAPG
jgi:hypothetical protein